MSFMNFMKISDKIDIIFPLLRAKSTVLKRLARPQLKKASLIGTSGVMLLHTNTET